MITDKHNFSLISINKEEVLKGVRNTRLLAPIPLFTSRRQEYTKLRLFKNRIELEKTGPNYKPYSTMKSSVMLYRTIFLGFGALYFLLGIILFFNSLNWSYTFLFGNSIDLKLAFCGLCAIASSSGILIGFTLRTEIEAAKRLYGKAKRRLKKFYDRKLVKFGVIRFLSFGQEYRKTLALKQMYLDSLEKLQEYKEETLQILDQIARSNSLDGRMKEELFNQAILELDDKMNLVIHTFKSSNPLKFIEA